MFCNIYDIISINETRDIKDKISFSGKFGRGINTKSNTITKALYLLRKNNIIKNKKFKINVKKNIPHGSGLGGGSSNAADLLNFFYLKSKPKIAKTKIIKIAKTIGFDVPICLEKKNTIIVGKYDQIIRSKKKFGLNILIIFPNLICSTKKIYSKNKKFSFLKKHKINYFKYKRSKLINLLKKENNDLEENVIKIYPKIKRLIELIKIQKGCYFSRITGSGSACIGIFSNSKAAIYTKKLIKFKFPNYWCVVSKTI
tara:strand:+ start:3481 stop:4248 length:768 start_codon:yes stop_codon:yes gene_type:complete